VPITANADEQSVALGEGHGKPLYELLYSTHEKQPTHDAQARSD
jgi:hypothetical protein